MADMIARGLAVSAGTAAAVASAKVDALPSGRTYKGAVNYYADLPASPADGDAWTVIYSGTSGTTPDGSEYA